MDTLGSGGYYTLMRVLDEYGLTKDDIRARTVTTPWDAYKEGSIDVLPMSQRIPSPSVIDIHTRRPVRLLSFEPEKLDSFLKNNAGYRKGIIPAGSYEMIKEDIQTIDASAVFFTNKDMPEELVYQVVKLMDENIDYLKLSDIHFQDYGFTPDVADSTLCPLHPGAERYYREIGLLK